MPVGKFEFKKLSLSPTCDGAFFSAPKTTKRSESVIDYKEVDSTCDMTGSALVKKDNVDCKLGMGKWIHDNVCETTTSGMDDWIDDDLNQLRAAKRTEFDSDPLIGETILVQCNAAKKRRIDYDCTAKEYYRSLLDYYENDSDKSDCDNGSASTSSSVQIMPPPKNDSFVELYVDTGGDDCSFKVVITEYDLL